MKKLLLFVLLLAASNLLATTYPFDDALANIVAGWHIDEGAGTTSADTEGGANPITDINGAAWVTGKYTNGLSFTQGADHAHIAASPLPQGAQARTFAFWYKWDGTSGNWQIIHYGYVNGNYQNYVIGFRPAYTPVEINFNSEGNYLVFNSTPVGATITSGAWVHVALSYDGNVTHKLYLNGYFVQTVTSANTLNTGSGRGILGAGWGDNAQCHGVLDDVVMFNVALTGAQVTSLYNGTAPVVAGAKPKTSRVYGGILD